MWNFDTDGRRTTASRPASVSVTYDNPRTAQQICWEITSIFIAQNSSQRINQATQTTDFLSGS
jgi:hypothetical protein